MGRPKQTIRHIYKTISLPEPLVARIELELFSEVEGKIPFGAQQEFFVGLITEYFAKLDGGVQQELSV
jgi:hypothetical protein